jgi:hypothetical protein
VPLACSSSLLCSWGHFFGSTAPQAFFRPNHMSQRPARTENVKAGRASRPPKAWPLHDRARRQALGVGLKRLLLQFSACHLGMSTAAGCMVLFAVKRVRRIMVFKGFGAAMFDTGSNSSHEELRGRRDPSRQGRRSLRMAAKGLKKAYRTAVAVVVVQRNGSPVIHMRCRITLSLRATAVVAFFLPMRRTRPRPHA